MIEDADETCERAIRLRGDAQRLLDAAAEELESSTVQDPSANTSTLSSASKKVSCHVRLPGGGVVHKQTLNTQLVSHCNNVALSKDRLTRVTQAEKQIAVSAPDRQLLGLDVDIAAVFIEDGAFSVWPRS